MRGRTKQVGISTTVAFLAIGLARAGAAAPLPEGFQGVWAAGGRCSDPRERLVITTTTAALGTAHAAAIFYAPNDDGAGHGALHWAEEGNTDNFVLLGPSGPIVHNSEGYGMPGQVVYKRCAA